ncbi:hypothetical protein [Limnoglobus roseus]|uniref:Uncharacterized protein n=1 Tax=Limnoglobus roseus TaxID=2598579 RepID=A0A5C1AJM6_9BACT|nr:hypothetical protein [Limnoglobus roseus]QEL18206.1 hypothetical protein PX52LOC_05220 [Limnoglobus roseus]
MMAWPTIICGALLTAIGSYGYLNATPKPDGSVSPTALIPAALGLILVLCGSLAFEAKRRKHVMHAAAMVGLLGVLGGFAPIIRQLANGKELDVTAPSAVAGLAMSAVSAVFVAMCVKSFIDARKARQAAAGVA